MAGRGDDRVDVELVDDVLRLVPPPLDLGDLGIHVRREHAVVHVVVVVVGLLPLHHNLLEELDHAATDETRDDHPDREAVVWRQVPAVVLVGDEDVIGGIHGVLHLQGGPVGAVGALRELLLGAAEGDVLGAVLWRLGADVVEEVAEAHARPVAGRDASGAPVEPDRLLDHVLLLAAVPGADQRDRDRDRRQSHEVVHGERLWLAAHALHGHPVLLPLDLCSRAVVADVVEARGGDEAVAHEVGERGLAVEGVAARQADQVGVAGHPAVGRVLVALVDRLDDLVQGHVRIASLEHWLLFRTGRHCRQHRSRHHGDLQWRGGCSQHVFKCTMLC